MLHNIPCKPTKQTAEPGEIINFSFRQAELTTEQVHLLQYFDGFFTNAETGAEFKLQYAELVNTTLRLGVPIMPAGSYTVTAAFSSPLSEVDVWKLTTGTPIQIGSKQFAATKPQIQTIGLSTGGNMVYKKDLDDTYFVVRGENLQMIDSVIFLQPFRLSVLRIMATSNYLTLRCLAGQSARFVSGMGTLQVTYHSYNETGNPVVDTLMLVGKLRFVG